MNGLEEHVSTFERDGVVVIEGFFDGEVMDRLDAAIAEHFGDRPDYRHDRDFVDGAGVEVVPWFPVRDDGRSEFDVIEDDERVQRLTEAVLGPEWYSQYCMAMFSRAGSAGQAWHQDSPPEDPDVFNLNRLVYTRDIDPAAGGSLFVVPGSHRSGPLPTGDPHEPLPGEIEVAPTRGTLAVVHGHCWHRVGAVHRGSRFSLNYRAAPVGTPEDITDVCVYRNMRYQFSTSEVVEQR